MKDRSDIIANICSIANSHEYTEDQKSKAKQLLADFVSGKVDNDQAEKSYSDIVSTGSNGGYWINKHKAKVVYASLKKYQINQLEDIEIRKMISSIITHSIIEMQMNPSITPEELGINELIDLLKYIMNNPINRSKIDDVLYRYGYLSNKVTQKGDESSDAESRS